MLQRLDAAALGELLRRAEADAGRALPLAPEARTALIAMADGDGRYLLNLAEELFEERERSERLRRRVRERSVRLLASIDAMSRDLDQRGPSSPQGRGRRVEELSTIDGPSSGRSEAREGGPPNPLPGS